MSKLKLQATDGNGGTVSLKGPASTTGNAEFELTLPGNAGSNGQVLATNGSGVLTWSNDANVGGATGVDFNDSVKARWGTGNDLEIFHDGTDSYIKDIGTGHLILNTSRLEVKNPASNEVILKGYENGAVELYYDNSKKLETHNTGLNVYGQYNNFYGGVSGTNINANLSLRPVGSAVYSNLYFYNSAGDSKSEITGYGGVGILFFTSNEFVFSSGGSERWMSNSTYLSPRSNAGLDLGGSSRRWGDVYIKDSKKIKLGDGDDLQIYHDGSTSRIKHDGTGDLSIQSNKLWLGNSGLTETYAELTQNAAVELKYDNVKKFETTSTGAKVTDWNLTVQAPGGHYARLHLIGNNASDNSQDFRLSSYGGYLKFEDYSTGAWQTGIQYVGNGAVELYHDNSKKLSTTANGIEIHDLDDTTTQAKFISSGGTLGSVYGNSANSFEFGLLDGVGNWAVRIEKQGGIELNYNNATKFETVSTGCELPDNSKLYLGTSGDLALHHDGSNSYIANTTGELFISASQVNIKSAAGEYMAYFNDNGEAALYYDDSKKFETTSAGINVAGSLRVSGNASGTSSSNCFIQAFYTNIGTSSSKTFTFSGLATAWASVRIGAYASSGQGALHAAYEFGGYMTQTNLYNVTTVAEWTSSASISTTKNASNYVVTITNGSSVHGLITQVCTQSSAENFTCTIS